jgi:hypothetical protein
MSNLWIKLYSLLANGVVTQEEATHRGWVPSIESEQGSRYHAFAGEL